MKKIFVLICLLLFVRLVFAEQKDDWQEFYNQSFDYLFNCEFDKAIECLEKAKELNPDNPVIYWRLTFAFWFKAEHDENLEKEDKKELEKKFNQMFDKGVALYDSDSVNPETLLYLGGLYGNKVLFKQALGEKNMSLLENTEKSREYLRKIKEAEDFYYEACGYLGIFNYGPIVMSWAQKTAARLAGYKWDLNKGLQQLKDAMNHSRYSDDIKFLYEGILMRLTEKEKYKDRIPEAIVLIEELIKKYPKNSFLMSHLNRMTHLFIHRHILAFCDIMEFSKRSEINQRITNLLRIYEFVYS